MDSRFESIRSSNRGSQMIIGSRELVLLSFQFKKRSQKSIYSMPVPPQPGPSRAVTVIDFRYVAAAAVAALSTPLRF
jgi:hypothetical protein